MGYCAGFGRIVSLRGIQKDVCGNRVFEGLDLDLEAGNFYALLGRGQSGKSTLLRILALREAVAEGAGLVFGVVLSPECGAIAQRIAFASTTGTVLPDLKIDDLFLLYAKFYDTWSDVIVARLAEGFGLDRTRRSGDLAALDLLKLRIVLALAYAPALILLDEVADSLDESSRDFLLHYLAERVQRHGATVVLATKSVAEVQLYATALVVLGDRHVTHNAPARAITAGLRKLRRPNGASHSVFSCNECVKVGATNNGEPRYLIEAALARSLGVPTALVAEEPITVEEVFEYLARPLP